MRLTLDQKRVLSEFLANLGITWFAGGVVAPVFTAKNLSESLVPGAWGILSAIVSLSFALLIVKKK